jgi:hypothetical protein
VTDVDWPARWQPQARQALQPYFGIDARLRILVDEPAAAVDGTVMEGFVYLDGSVPTVIYDHSGRSDVYPWRLLAGPVLRIYELTPRREPRIVYAHPEWRPRPGL